MQDGEGRVISYFSKCLLRAERQYCTTRKELLAVVKAAKHFHFYLIGQDFTIRTDHGSLKWLMRFKNCEGQIARWIETLSAYTFAIVHHASRVPNNADSMSCRPCYSDMCKYRDSYEYKYFPEIVDLNAGLDDVVQKSVTHIENVGEDNVVTLPCIGSDTHVIYPDGGWQWGHSAK